MIKEDKM
ncbi:hypothetical protein J8A68_005996, partial [[Candida] subhashii]